MLFLLLQLARALLAFLLRGGNRRNSRDSRGQHGPSEQEVARAMQAMRRESNWLYSAIKAIKRRVKKKFQLVDLHLLVEGKTKFRAYVFFKKDSDIHDRSLDGTIDQIKEVVYEDLENVSPLQRPDLTVEFEIDSDENVKKNYQGNYSLRLR
ncbi:MAG TPA: hypothetical protein VGN12_25065 [Pirellulales bacterium]|jgi:hypothetical protein